MDSSVIVAFIGGVTVANNIYNELMELSTKEEKHE